MYRTRDFASLAGALFSLVTDGRLSSGMAGYLAAWPSLYPSVSSSIFYGMDGKQYRWVETNGWYTIEEIHASPPPSPPSDATCLSHVWKPYVGLTDAFDYCSICDVKRRPDDVA